MAATPDPTESFLEALIAGDIAALRSGFDGEPDVDDPLAGRVRGAGDFERFAAERQAWLDERAARLERLPGSPATHGHRRSVFEALLHLRLPAREIALPVGVVGDHANSGRLRAVRVYHSLWPLLGAHRVRAALLPRDPALRLTGVVAEYQRALASGDVEAIVGAFEPGGYFREPAGGDYVYHGVERLRSFMAHLLGPGGIPLEHCTMTDDGVACAIEFNAVQFGPHRLEPQAGLAVYERGPSGRLRGARIYDDVDVEAYTR